MNGLRNVESSFPSPPQETGGTSLFALRQNLPSSMPAVDVRGDWDLEGVRSGMASSPTALTPASQPASEPRIFCVRVKGKKGHFRYGLFDESAAQREQKRMAKKRDGDTVTVERWGADA